MLRTRFLGLARLILMSALLTSCSHGLLTELPTAPDPATTIRTLSITPLGGGLLIAGENVPITSSGPFSNAVPVLGAFAEYGDGSAKYIPATWSSSDVSVLAFNGAAMTAISPGEVTVTARADRMTATARFRVEPTMAGTWSGTFIVDQCGAGSGSMQELICSNVPGHVGELPPGTVVPITFSIQKDDAALTASAQFGDLRGALTGSDLGANTMRLTGTLARDKTTVSVVFWNARVMTDVMEGALGFEVRISGLPEHAAVTAHLANVTRR